MLRHAAIIYTYTSPSLIAGVAVFTCAEAGKEKEEEEKEEEWEMKEGFVVRYLESFTSIYIWFTSVYRDLIRFCKGFLSVYRQGKEELGKKRRFTGERQLGKSVWWYLKGFTWFFKRFRVCCEGGEKRVLVVRCKS
ncbi:hypothetical protein E2C01_094015 [Portunus trituberculatus]|uniref:Uncharacterized protein n=1 Tax=Portunus trituberculatus TaxID=210409 RepID=A0A5B7K0C3_PORTR|nr:hypothetical protein [Portunus trituberculatus]